MADDNITIRVKNLSKDFRLPLGREDSIKGKLIQTLRGGKASYRKQHVLKNVSFEIKKGEFFGIVGRNGSGKSTMLKLLAGIYEPTKGEIHIGGKLTPFIELGVGFNAELTGRENVFLNGALLGFSRKDVAAMYDSIVAFAELEKFMDQKLKNYSSGMQVRLAFSIAIRVETDILLIDEVLAVGDANFQRKCLNMFTDMKKAKKTVVFISHDMGAVRRFCDRAIMIQDGEIVDEGSPDEIASRYEIANIDTSHSVEAINDAIKDRANKIVTKLELRNEKGEATSKFTAGDSVHLLVHLQTRPGVKNMGVAIYRSDGGYVFGTNTINDKFLMSETVQYVFDAELGEGEYQIKLGIFGDDDSTVYEFFDEGPVFFVSHAKPVNWQGTVELPHKWSNA